LAAFRCNQIRATGILPGRLRSGSLLQTVGRLGIISSNHLFRAAVLDPRQWWPGSVMNIALELFDGLLLIFDYGLDQVPNGDHPHHPPPLDYRQMADPPLGHEMHAVLNSLIRCNGDDR
jgi:hypothetical protein